MRYGGIMDIDLKIQKNFLKLSLNIKSYFLMEYIFKGGDIAEAAARMPLVFSTQDAVTKEIDNMIKKEIIDENLNINLSLATSVYFSDVVKPKKVKRQKPEDHEKEVVACFNALFGKNFKTLKSATKQKIKEIGVEESIRCMEYASKCSWLDSKRGEYWFTIEWVINKHSEFSDTGKYAVRDYKQQDVNLNEEDGYGF